MAWTPTLSLPDEVRSWVERAADFEDCTPEQYLEAAVRAVTTVGGAILSFEAFEFALRDVKGGFDYDDRAALAYEALRSGQVMVGIERWLMNDYGDQWFWEGDRTRESGLSWEELEREYGHRLSVVGELAL